MTAPHQAPWPHPGYPPPPPPDARAPTVQAPVGYGAPPPPPVDPRERARRSVVLGVVALALGVVALLVSWVPWVNLLGLLLALGGLGVGVFAAVRRRGAARGLGIGGAAASLLALGVVLVLLAISAFGFFRERAQDAAADAPPAASGPGTVPPSAGPSDREVIEADMGEEMALAGYTGVVTSMRAGVSWDPPADPDAGDPPTTATVEHTLVLASADGSPLSLMGGQDVEATMAAADGAVLDEAVCGGSDDDVVSERSLDSGTGVLTRRDCYALPVDYEGTVTITVTTPQVPGSPGYVVGAEVSIAELLSEGP